MREEQIVEGRAEDVDRIGVDGGREQADPDELGQRIAPADADQTGGENRDDDDQRDEVVGPQHGRGRQRVAIETVDQQAGGRRDEHEERDERRQVNGDSACGGLLRSG